MAHAWVAANLACFARGICEADSLPSDVKALMGGSYDSSLDPGERERRRAERKIAQTGASTWSLQGPILDQRPDYFR